MKKKVLKTKKPKRKLVAWMAIVSLGCLILGSVWFVAGKTSEQAVAGITTTMPDTALKQQTSLTCGQCLKQAGNGQSANLCFHQDGTNSYAQCRSGTTTSITGNTTCISCGINQCTPRPTTTCTQGTVTNVTLSGSCTQTSSYHFVSYTCSDGSSGQLGNANLCINGEAWRNDVNRLCGMKRKCTPVVTPGAGGWCEPTPNISPKPEGCQTVCRPMGIACRMGLPCKQYCTKVCATPEVTNQNASSESSASTQ